jgi:hypothetical protein
MIHRGHIFLAGLFVAIVGLTYGATTLNKHIAPDNLYPNPTVSPGLVATTDFNELTAVTSCGTYSQCHRNTPESLKKQVRAEYPNCPSQQEIDHIIPLALGGQDALGNLWCQSGVGRWNYHDKDKLESYLVLQMKAGKITPKDAQTCVLTDWIRCFQKYNLGAPTYGGVDNGRDPDSL